MNSTASCLLALLVAPGALLADRLSFQNGDLVTGTILEMDAQGHVLVESPDTPAPLRLRVDTLSSAEFDQPPPAEQSGQERINLVNGDVLPGTVSKIDASHIDLHTWFAGDLHIPRATVRSIDFGIAPSKLTYQGPGGPEGWLDNEEWKFTSSGATSSGRGTASRPRVLPDNFILRFKLAWVSNPNFRFYFCDDHLEATGAADRYYFEVNQGGMQLKRQSSDSNNRTWYPLYTSQRRPSSFDNDDVEIELRVDRTRRLIYIYIDDELEGRYPDLIEKTPEGKGIMLESTSPSRDTKNILTSIEIFQWDAVSQLHRAEGHEDTTLDAVITTDSQRYPGDARELVMEGDERIIILKNPHAEDLLRVPVSRTSVLYLRHEDTPPQAAADLTLDLADHGFLHLSEPRLLNGVLQGRHPMLGEMSIQRGALKRLQATEPDSTEPAP